MTSTRRARNPRLSYVYCLTGMACHGDQLKCMMQAWCWWKFASIAWLAPETQSREAQTGWSCAALCAWVASLHRTVKRALLLPFVAQNESTFNPDFMVTVRWPVGLIRRVREAVGGRIPIHVLIRPREGDFIYDTTELQVR